MTRTNRRVGIVLFQLGGPDTLEAIEPFLYNLFCDPDIIDFPFARIGRKPLAKLISSTRARKVQHHYATIGGGSPIRRHTERQAKALERELQEEGIDAHCFVAMRYWHPFTSEAIDQVRQAECDELVLLPMYPQYSSTTTGSSLNEWNRQFCDDIPVHRIESFYRNPAYLDAVAHKVDEALHRFTDSLRPEILFSAHSVPVAVVEKGDPYQRQIEETVRLVMQRGGWSNAHRLCYQSKVGASRWLQPSLHTTLRQLAADKKREVCIVPIAFVSDHVETLGEIDHEARHLAQELGFTRFEMSAGLNDSPKFINALSQIVQEALAQADLLPMTIRIHGRKLAEPQYAAAAGLDSGPVRQRGEGGFMAEFETDKVNPNPEAAKTPAKPAVDATKYVGTPAVGTSKAAAAGGVAGTAPSTEIDRKRRRFVWTMVTAFLTAWFLAFFRFFLPRTLFEPNTVFKIGYPSEFALGVDTKFQQKYRIWVDRTPDRLFVIYARCTHLGCTPDWKPSENKFKCPCHGSGYDSEGINFEGPAPRPMDRAHIELAPDGQVLVDTAKLYSWPKGQPTHFNDPGAFLTGV